ncbi:MAG: hypothetical protein HZB38_14015 [Planctomycetes bacterium]|nr:hypothetical protein [Planctomycetota bacterium]
MSTVIDIADAVVGAIQSGSYGEPVAVERKYRPTFELADLTEVQVSVVPRAVSITTATRDSSYFDCAIDVGVQKKVNADQAEDIDALMTLVEQIADQLRMKRLDDAPEAAWVSIENEPAFASEHLDQQRVFTSVLTVTYRVRR